MCAVYLEVGGDGVVVATCANASRARIEVDGGSRRVDRDPESLGRVTLEALDACEWWSEFNLRDRQGRDWLAFKASGERSVRAFEARWQSIGVRGSDDDNLIWMVDADLEDRHPLTLSVSHSPVTDAVGLGERIFYLDERRRTVLAALRG